MIGWLIAGVASAALTLWVVAPRLFQMDLVPLAILVHPAFYDKAMTISYALPIVNALLVWLWGTWGLRRLGRWWVLRRSESVATPEAGAGARAGFYGLVSVSLVPLVLAAMALPVEVQHGFGATYGEVCGSCHPADRALAFVRSPEAWRLTVERHRRYAPEHFEDDRVAAALDYLIAKRSLSGEDLFRVKCLACHRQKTFDDPRTPVEWSRIVSRIARFHPFFLSPMEEQDLSDFIVSGLSLPDANWDDAEQRRRDVFEVGCAQCHTLDVIMINDVADDAWPDILARMAQKVPGLIEEDEAQDLVDWILNWRRRPEAFAEAFPHHRPDLFFKRAYR